MYYILTPKYLFLSVIWGYTTVCLFSTVFISFILYAYCMCSLCCVSRFIFWFFFYIFFLLTSCQLKLLLGWLKLNDAKKWNDNIRSVTHAFSKQRWIQEKVQTLSDTNPVRWWKIFVLFLPRDNRYWWARDRYVHADRLSCPHAYLLTSQFT